MQPTGAALALLIQTLRTARRHRETKLARTIAIAIRAQVKADALRRALVTRRDN